MSADLTVDSLCGAIRHFLREAAGDKPPPHSHRYALVLHGVPADDTMKAVMEVLGGTLRIEVRELPAELAPSGNSAGGEDQGAILWQPNKAAGDAPVESATIAEKGRLNGEHDNNRGNREDSAGASGGLRE